jgi:glycosyltransferase involved in cell wall biosynthesis
MPLASAPELWGASRLLAYTPPPVLPVYYNRVANAVNQRLLLRYLRRCLARLGWQVDVLWTYWPNTAHLIGRLGEKVSVYHCIDDFAAVGYPMTSRRTIVRMEAQQCRKVDLILTRTAALTTAKRRLNPNTHFLPGGVDTDHFDPSRVRPPPPELADLPRPRVGFVGTIDDRLDVKLLVRCAVALPGATIVLVGPIRWHRVDLRPLRSLGNVRFLPPCPHSQVPAIVGAFDVCLIPYRVNEYTRGLSPVKLYEYLAMGKPVVATNLPYLRREAAHIRIGETPQEFLAEIRAALVPRSMGVLGSSPSTQEREKWRAVAQAHSWERQVSEIERRLEPLLEGDACTP